MVQCSIPGHRNSFGSCHLDHVDVLLTALSGLHPVPLRQKLKGGLDRTREVRHTRIEDGNRMLLVYLGYLGVSLGLYIATMALRANDHVNLCVRVAFAFTLGGRGVPDMIVWRLVRAHPELICDD